MPHSKSVFTDVLKLQILLELILSDLQLHSFHMDLNFGLVAGGRTCFYGLYRLYTVISQK